MFFKSEHVEPELYSTLMNTNSCRSLGSCFVIILPGQQMVPWCLKKHNITFKGTQLYTQRIVCICRRIGLIIWPNLFFHCIKICEAWQTYSHILSMMIHYGKPLSFSARKRMSVIVRTPSGKLRLYCKGAVSFYFCLLQFWFMIVFNVHVKHSSMEM